MLRTHRAGKVPGSCGGWSLGSRNRRGPVLSPIPGLRGQGSSPGSPAGFLGSSGWGKCPPHFSSSPGLGGTLPPASPDLPGLPLMPPGLMHWGWGRGCLGGQGTGLGAQQAPQAQVDGSNALAPLSLLPDGSSRQPLLISWPPSYTPKDPRSLEGALEGREPAWELSRLPVHEWVGQSPSAPLPAPP